METSADVNKFRLFRRTLAPGARSVVSKVSSLSEAMGMNVFLVGGTVRDFLIGRRSDDIDMATEGSAIELGRALADKYSLKIKEYGKFGTCTLMFPRQVLFWRNRKEIRVDIAMAREETYSAPGVPPRVSSSTMIKDLSRRDFTLNAMAIGLTGANSGVLKDACGGMKDLENGVIKVLHDNSFEDDPSRIFRAVRFETRLAFRIDDHTATLIKQAVENRMIRRMRESRVRDEWALVLREGSSGKCIKRLEGLLDNEMRYVLDVVSRGGK